MTQQRADYPLDYSKTAGEQVTDRVQEAAASAQEIADKAMHQAKEYGEQAQEAFKSFKPYVEKTMKEQPMAALAVAAIIGAVLGALWKK